MTDDERSTGGGADTAPGYAPPPSPAYAPSPPPVRGRRTAPAADGGRPDPRPEAGTGREGDDGGGGDGGGDPAGTRAAPGADDRRERTRRRALQLLVAGIALVAFAGGIVTAAIALGGDADEPRAGTVTSSTGTVTAQVDGEEPRALSPGDAVELGTVVETGGAAAATIELAGGTVVRLDARARVTLDGDGPETGEDGSAAEEPAVVVRPDDGRLWLRPPASGPVPLVEIPHARVSSEGHPFGVDCTAACAVEAPAGGVVVATTAGASFAPAAGEVLAVAGAEDLDLALAGEPSDWARRNLEADEAAGFAPPRPDEGAGIARTAVLDGTYPLVFEIVGPPEGDPVPEPLRYPEGGTYAVVVTADGSGCEAPPCDVPVGAADGASGTAHVAEGTVTLDLGQPIDCYDQSFTDVVAAGIGTATATATLTVDGVDYLDGRWRIRSLSGSGALGSTLTTRCDPGDVLGTTSSPASVTSR